MKKLLITGAGGFLGASASHYFSSAGFEVYAASRNPSDSWRLSLLQCKKLALDITSRPSCDSALKISNPDAILNFAAYGAYPGAQTDASMMKKTNIDGALNLLEAASKNSVPRFIQIGSSSEYGQKDCPMQEADECNPANDYAKTKFEATKLALKNWGPTKITVIRPFSPFGEFEEPRRLIPTLILSALIGVPAKLSSPNSMRDFMYVQNFNEGVARALESDLASGEIFNLSQGAQTSVGEMANLAHSLVPSSPLPIFGAVANPRDEPKMWQADISKAKRILNWSPRISVKDGLQKTISWIKAHRNFYAQ